MNCKQGELVRFVGETQGNSLPVFGWIGKVVSYKRCPLSGDAWIVEPPMPGGNVRNGPYKEMANWIADKALRPIRDPGDDATDEMIVLLGKPEKETV